MLVSELLISGSKRLKENGNTVTICDIKNHEFFNHSDIKRCNQGLFLIMLGDVGTHQKHCMIHYMPLLSVLISKLCCYQILGGLNNSLQLHGQDCMPEA